MQGFRDDAEEHETENGAKLRQQAERREIARAGALVDDDAEIMTDGGRPGSAREEARAVAGPETLEEQDLEGKRQALDEVHGRDDVEVRGDGQPETGARHFGGGR